MSSIFDFFHVPRADQSKVLLWGVLGALAFRATFIVGALAPDGRVSAVGGTTLRINPLRRHLQYRPSWATIAAMK